MAKDSFNETENIASASECTGLVPALPMDDSQAVDDLTRLYAVHTPKKRNGVRWEGKGERPRS